VNKLNCLKDNLLGTFAGCIGYSLPCHERIEAMRTARFFGLIGVCMCVVTLSGCGTRLADLQIQNDIQANRIKELTSLLGSANMELDQLKRQLASADGITSAKGDQLRARIIALEEDIALKKKLIKSMQAQLLTTGAQLPVELTTKLEELALKYPMISYDSERGVLKFESDLTFVLGSDQVTGSAVTAVQSLCSVLNSEEAKGFDVVVAGHTDDVRISRAETRAKHPTNWHLSAHRGISVTDLMIANSVEPVRLSVRGFGEYRPVEPNKPDKKGNPKNRRVEIFIVAKGM
jgi:chemotaxis protein MotB